MEDLIQTHAGSVFATSVSLSPHKPCLIDSVCHVLMVSSTPLAYTILPPPLPGGSPVCPCSLKQTITIQKITKQLVHWQGLLMSDKVNNFIL